MLYFCFRTQREPLGCSPVQDVPFFYTPSHLNELKVLSQLSQPIFLSFSYLNSTRHNLVIELCREKKKSMVPEKST